MNRKKERILDDIKSGNWTIAEIAINYKPFTSNQAQIASIAETYQLIRSLWDDQTICIQEQFVAFYFNTANRILGHRVICTGNMKSCLVDVKLLCSLALHSLCSAVVIAHNHPSGNLKPSEKDFAITLKIQQALQLIDVELLDHFIISDSGYASFAECGWL